MSSPPRVQLRSFSSASDAQVRTGLLGWLTVEVDGLLVLDGITLRRINSLPPRMGLSFPERRDRAGRHHPLVRPIDDDARCLIERSVLAALRDRGVPL